MGLDYEVIYVAKQQDLLLFFKIQISYKLIFLKLKSLSIHNKESMFRYLYCLMNLEIG